MTELVLQVDVAAPPERCFDLARSMDFHCYSMTAFGEKIVGGRASGLIELGEEVEFQARHLGITRRLRARITEFQRPHRFVDEQIAGAFKLLRHEHNFEAAQGGTRVTDRIRMSVGWSVLGLVVERLVLAPHLTRVLTAHHQHLKAAAESEEWRRFLEQPRNAITASSAPPSSPA
jgi:ligand-binding SRPBCC domain-containing protein